MYECLLEKRSAGVEGTEEKWKTTLNVATAFPVSQDKQATLPADQAAASNQDRNLPALSKSS